MKKIIIFIVFIMIISFTGVFIGYLVDNNGTLNENDAKILGINPQVKVELTVSSEGPFKLDELIRDIRTKPYYEGYNNETLIWMKSLPQKEVFISDDAYVIMNKHDASKINSEYVTDAYIEEYINCIIVENHSLGGNHTKDVLLVKDVENLGNHTYFLQDA